MGVLRGVSVVFGVFFSIFWVFCFTATSYCCFFCFFLLVVLLVCCWWVGFCVLLCQIIFSFV